MYRVNPILATDSYKVSHWLQYPPRTQHVFSYLEARMGAKWPATVFFAAMNYYLRDILQPITFDDLQEAESFSQQHFGNADIFNLRGWGRILLNHDGRFPVKIRAVPEGTLVPVSNVLLTIENEDPELPWVTNYLETRFSQMWYPITVATQSFYARQAILKWLELTGDPSLIDFKLHDFGYRGVSSQETAAIGGLAHLVNFKGTDTMAALSMAKRYYGEPMAGFSIPAAEHSTITSWGRDHEVDAFRNMLDVYPAGLVAVVSDSYDIYAACEHLWGELLHDDVVRRNGTLVIRPDSGIPGDVVPAVLELLGQKFGYTVNSKGYRVLDPHVRVIQGDGIKPPVEAIDHILACCTGTGWSADNVAFGSGGGLLQDVNRDTQRFAFKCSAICIDGLWKDVYKAPTTDMTKASKAGRLTLYQSGEHYYDHYYTAAVGGSPSGQDVMETVYEKGEIRQGCLRSLSGIRATVHSSVPQPALS